jgi:hypothetical protein
LTTFINNKHQTGENRMNLTVSHRESISLYKNIGGTWKEVQKDKQTGILNRLKERHESTLTGKIADYLKEKNLPQLAWQKNFNCIGNSIDNITPDDMPDAIMWGIDDKERLFLSLKCHDLEEYGKPSVVTLFQFYSKNGNNWREANTDPLKVVDEAYFKDIKIIIEKKTAHDIKQAEKPTKAVLEKSLWDLTQESKNLSGEALEANQTEIFNQLKKLYYSITLTGKIVDYLKEKKITQLPWEPKFTREGDYIDKVIPYNVPETLVWGLANEERLFLSIKLKKVNVMNAPPVQCTIFQKYTYNANLWRKLITQADSTKMIVHCDQQFREDDLNDFIGLIEGKTIEGYKRADL